MLNSDVPAPGFFSGPAVKAKYSAWKTHGEKYAGLAKENAQVRGDSDALSFGQARAKERYIEIAREVGWTEPNQSQEEGSGQSKGSGMGMKVSVMRAAEDIPSPSETE